MNKRRELFRATVFLLFSLPLVESAGAQHLVSPADLPGSGSAKGEVIGGREANPKDWPATFVFVNSADAGCTATAVSPRVILTAAHCLGKSSGATVTLRGQKIPIACDNHSGYPANIAADFALCLTGDDLQVPDRGFETVDIERKRPTQNEEVTLLGYGCRQAGGTDRNFGKLFWGSARVSQIRDKDGFVLTNGGAAVCFGDSGGGAYFNLNSNGTIRRLFAVNARGDIRQESFLAPTASPTFIDWAREWTAGKSNQTSKTIGICGMHEKIPSCRQ